MTRRKPAHVSFPTWVDQQVRQAEAEGAFDALPGKGKPIPDLDRQQDDMAWIANYLRRENVDVADVLPPALRLAKEVDTLDERLRTIRSEARARQVAEDLNRRIDEAYARPQLSGPPLRVKKVRVEEALARWRAARPPAAPPAPPAEPPAPRRRWRIGPRRASSRRPG